MIEIENLTVQFGSIKPLDALSVKLGASIVGLIGPNGAGKTTLLNVLSGFATPVGGRVTLDGKALLELSPVARVKLGLRRAFQQELVVLDMTAAENVRSIADHVSRPGRAKAEVDRAINYVGLDDRRDVLGRNLTLFERRMVEIAKTLIGAPKVILLDEPGAGLNDSESLRLREILLGIPEAFSAQLVLIDHDADLIAAICEETIVLDFGRLLASGPTRQVLEEPAVRKAYLGTS
jgi:branched-chain amino acid transport system ATP-binding protein